MKASPETFPDTFTIDAYRPTYALFAPSFPWMDCTGFDTSVQCIESLSRFYRPVCGEEAVVCKDNYKALHPSVCMVWQRGKKEYE